MKRSTEAILTTHTGSLPRPPDLLELLLERHQGHDIDKERFEALVAQSVRDTVKRQADVGLTVVNDGEQSKVSYAGYLKDRIDGFEVRDLELPAVEDMGAEARAFPDFYDMWRRRNRPTTRRTNSAACCVGPLSWKDFTETERDIANLKAAREHVDVADCFMTAPSPAIAAGFQHNAYYPSDEEYLNAIANVMKREYEAIVAAGFILQIDCPDLTVGYRMRTPEFTIDDFRQQIAGHIEILNHATRDIDPEQMRIHVCWGADEAPHHEDPTLESIVDVLLTARPMGMTIVGANARHEFEWQVWKNVKVPDGKVIIPGVIDSTTNIIEHPETVAERIEKYASVLGRENIIAGVDCGFDTLADFGQVYPEIAWAKLTALAEGARIASERLW